MAYEIEVGAKADKQISDLDPVIGASVERKIIWLGTNAAQMVHRRLVGMTEDLEGLCRLRLGDYRIQNWVYHNERIVRIYRVSHRSEVYRDL